MTRLVALPRSLALLYGIALVGPCPMSAQTPAPPQAADWRAFAMRGEASVFSEAYSISGRAPRRPAATARVVFQPVIEMTRFLRVGLDLQLTTEGTGTGAGTDSP